MVFAAQFFGVHLSFSQYVPIALVSVLGSAATAGTTGAVVMLTLTLSTLGLPLAGAGLLLAIDPILDMCRTAVNVAGQAPAPLLRRRWPLGRGKRRRHLEAAGFAAAGAMAHWDSIRPQRPAAHQQRADPMIIVTSNDIPGYKIDAVFGEVMGLTVRSRNIGAQFTASFRSIGGGELPEMTKALVDSRHEVMARMVAEAQEKGANAVVAMRFDTSEMGQTWTEVCVYGTAVYAVPLGEGQPGATGQSIYLTKNPQTTG